MKLISVLSKKDKDFLVKGVEMAVILQAFVIIFQVLTGEGLVNNRPLGMFGEPNAAAGFLVLGSIFLLKKIANKDVFYIFVVLVGLYFTQSRSAILAMVVVILGLVVNIKKHKVAIPLMAFGVLIGALVLIGGYFSRTMPQMSTDSAVWKLESRAVYWEFAIEEIKNKPILGYGAESGEAIYDRAFSRKEIKLDNFFVDRSHNLFLDVAMWSGVVGLVLFLGWLFHETKYLSDTRNYLNLVGVVSWLVFASLQPLGVVHWLMLGIFFDL